MSQPFPDNVELCLSLAPPGHIYGPSVAQRSSVEESTPSDLSKNRVIDTSRVISPIAYPTALGHLPLR